MSYAPTPGRLPSHGMGGSPALSGNALAVASMILWSAGFPAAELLLEDWHPMVLIGARITMAMAALIPLWWLLDGGRAIFTAPWIKGMRIGFFGFGLGTSFILFAQWYTDAVTVALVASATPILAAMVEVWDGQRRLTRTFVAGLALSVVGGAIAVGDSISPDLGIGVLFALASGFLFVWASNGAVRQLPEMTPIGRSTVTFGGAMICVWIMSGTALALGFAPLPTEVTGHHIGLLAIFAVAAMGLSQVLFIAAVGRIGIALTSFHINIAPFYVMVIIASMGGGWNLQAVLGATIVGVGVLWSQRTPRARFRNAPPTDAS